MKSFKEFLNENLNESYGELAKKFEKYFKGHGLSVKNLGTSLIVQKPKEDPSLGKDLLNAYAKELGFKVVQVDADLYSIGNKKDMLNVRFE